MVRQDVSPDSVQPRQSPHPLLTKLQIPILLASMAFGAGCRSQLPVPDATAFPPPQPRPERYDDPPPSEAEHPAFELIEQRAFRDVLRQQIRSLHNRNVTGFDYRARAACDALPAPSKKLLIDRLPDHLTGTNPVGFQQHLVWFQQAAVLRQLSPEAYKIVEPRVMQQLLIFIDSLGTSVPSQTLPQIDSKERKILACLSTLPPSAAGFCTEALSELTEAVNRFTPLQIQNYIRTQKLYTESRSKRTRRKAIASFYDSVHGFSGSLKDLQSELATVRRMSREDDGSPLPALAGISPIPHDMRGYSYSCNTEVQGLASRWNLEFHRQVGRNNQNVVVLRNQSEPRAAVALFESAFRDALKHGSLDALCQKAAQDFVSEHSEENAQRLNLLDLHGKVVHIRVLPHTGLDKVALGFHFASQLFSSALNHRYGDKFVMSKTIISDAPMKDIERTIEALHKEHGEITVCLEFLSHGSEEKLCFEQDIQAPALADLTRYCHLTLLTPACYGGNLAPELKQELSRRPELADKVEAFFQTTPELVNFAGLKTTGFLSTPAIGEELFGSFYTMCLIDCLYDPTVKTFGEAVRKADSATQRSSLGNPQSVVAARIMR